jgi:hypothetical protein
MAESIEALTGKLKVLLQSVIARLTDKEMIELSRRTSENQMAIYLEDARKQQEKDNVAGDSQRNSLVDDIRMIRNLRDVLREYAETNRIIQIYQTAQKEILTTSSTMSSSRLMRTIRRPTARSSRRICPEASWPGLSPPASAPTNPSGAGCTAAST